MAPANSDGAIAITGLACRLPGEGDNVESFWDSICNGTSAWSKIPRDRFNPDAFSPNVPANGGHFLREDISQFDANFFLISHAEACAMDPQQRLMIEVAYEALEAAGYSLEDIAGTSTGVYMGQFTSDYKELIYRDMDAPPQFSLIGAQATSLANRISWLFDLRGPSFTIDTACSSSLVAFHLACQSLQSGETEMAIVGGCNLLITPEMFISEGVQGFLSPDGKCKTFDVSADGYGRGEGFAVLVLKRVKSAVSDGDPIRAVIRGTGSNQDGHTKSLTLPSSEAQAALIHEVYDRAGLDLSQTSYVEAHGTGTKAGDLGETTALAKTIAAARSGGERLVIGSVKANIGHLEGGAGVAAVVKSVLMLENGTIPPNIHFHNPNPAIKFDEWNIKIPTKLTPWPTDGLRRISINSFGYGGTNAHAILDDAHSYLTQNGLDGVHFTKGKAKSAPDSRRNEAVSRLFAISAQDKDGVGRVKKSLAAFLGRKITQLPTEQESIDYLADLAFTLNERRSHLQWKTFSVASSIEELLEVLLSEEYTTPTFRSSRMHRLGFVFTGQGAQWANMGIELLKYQTFRNSITAADAYLREELDCTWSAAEELARGKSTSNIKIALYSQALCTVLQVALVDLLKEWDIVPESVVGHSSGEIAAAYCLGVLSREDAWKVAYFRGLLSSNLRESGHEGAMMAVGASPEDTEEMIAQYVPGEVHVACINSPQSITVSGDVEGVDKFHDALLAKGVFARKLQVDTAYHSPHMQLVAQEYYEAIADISTNTPTGTCKMYSSVSGSIVEPSELGPAYWVRNLVSPVRFAPAVQNLVRPLKADSSRSEDKAVDILVEIGPHSALQGPTTQSLKAIGLTDVPYFSALTRHQSGIETALALAGTLFAKGYPLDFSPINQVVRQSRPLVDLPSYPWNHSRVRWAETRIVKEYRLREPPRGSLLGPAAPALVAGERVFRGHLKLSQQPWIADHKIQGSILYPAAGFIAFAIEAVLSGAEPAQRVTKLRLRDIQLTAAVIVTEEEPVEYSVSLRPHLTATRDTSGAWSEFIVTSSRDGGALERNCLGLIMVEYESSNNQELVLADKASMARYREAAGQCRTAIRPDKFYEELTGVGLQYGPTFQNVTEVWTGLEQSCCTIDIPDVGLGTPQRPHVIHPGTLDAIFHMAFAALKGPAGNLTQAMVPKSIDGIVISADIPYEAGMQLKGHSNVSRHGFKEILSDIFMADEAKDRPVLQISGFCCTEVSGASSADSAKAARSLCSKLIWRPAINLLRLEEQKLAVSRALSSQDKSLAATLSEFIKLAHHCNPGMSISEIAIDAHSRPFLSDFDDVDVLKTANCTVWCSNESAVQAAEETFESESIKIELQDLSQTLSDEEKTKMSSDLIIVPAAAAQFEHILRNAQQLLSSDGRLCLIVPARKADDVEALGREIGLTEWIKFGDSDGTLTLLVGSGTVNTNVARNEGEVIILQSPAPSKAAAAAAVQLAKSLSVLGYKPDLVSWGGDDLSLKGKTCISLLEIDGPILHEMDEEDFTQVKELILETDGVLWVTSPGDPSSAMVTGLARVVRGEEPGLKFRTLNFGLSGSQSASQFAQQIVRVFECGTADNEFMIEDETIHVSRIVEDDALNGELDLLNSPNATTTSKVALAEAGPIKLCIQNAGLLDSLCFELDDAPDAPLEEDEIEITVKAASINFRDVMTVMGQLPGTLLGFDGAGVVIRVGSAVSNFNIGDRVVTMNPGALRTVHRAKAAFCQKLPDELTFEAAATIPVVHGTAWYALVRLAGVAARKGQTILIHAAAGGVGQCAIQIAKHAGMEIFATVGSDVKRSLIRDTYGIPDDHIFNSRDLTFVDGIKRMTKGRGVDVVLNSLSGEVLRQTWHCIAPFGYFIEIGVKDMLANGRLDMKPFLQDATFTFFNLKRIVEERPDITADIMQGVFDLQRKGITRPVTPIAAYPASDVESAFRIMQTGKHLGKVVVTFADEQQSITVLNQRRKKSLDLDPNAAYVLVGGLGGLGRSLSTMLVDNGARQICFVSRSGAKSPAAQKLVQDIQNRGVRVLVSPCDVADAKAVQNAIKVCSQKLGPVRGVIQCAMVLRDTLFRNMTHQGWVESIRPKVQGTWNLHQALPSVDFFVVLSSFSGIFGNRGQSNYAAAGAYQDAISHFRRAQGLHAVTIDLGLIRDVGVLAEQGMLAGLRDWEVPYGIREHELVNLVKVAIAGDVSGELPPQIITGLATGGSAITAGIDQPWYLSDSKFAIMAKTGIRESAGDAEQGSSVESQLSEAKSEAEATAIVTEALVARVAKMLQTTAGEIDTDRFLHSYGIDSLVAIEVVNWALEKCKSRITVFDIMAAVPITATARKIAANSTLIAKESAQA